MDALAVTSVSLGPRSPKARDRGHPQQSNMVVVDWPNRFSHRISHGIMAKRGAIVPLRAINQVDVSTF
jgi:hypothetical protein